MPVEIPLFVASIHIFADYIIYIYIYLSIYIYIYIYIYMYKSLKVMLRHHVCWWYRSCEVTISAGWVTLFPIHPPLGHGAGHRPRHLRRHRAGCVANGQHGLLNVLLGHWENLGASQAQSSTRETIDCNPDFPMKMCEFMGSWQKWEFIMKIWEFMMLNGTWIHQSWETGHVAVEVTSIIYSISIYIYNSLCSDKIRVEIANCS